MWQQVIKLSSEIERQYGNKDPVLFVVDYAASVALNKPIELDSARITSSYAWEMKSLNKFLTNQAGSPK